MAFNTPADKAERIVINLEPIVNSGIDAVAIVEKRERAVKEARFHQVVSEQGLSYNDQLERRQEMRNQELKQVTPDSEYLAQLDVEIANLKKLRRFERIREDYYDAYDELLAGNSNLKEFRDFISGVLQQESDPEVREEYRKELSDINKQIASEEIATLNNRVSLAQQDGTESILRKTIRDVEKRQAFAKSNGNDEEATAWDVTLSSLNKQLSQKRIEDSIHDISFDQFKAGGSVGAISKLEKLDSIIKSASSKAPVTVDGVTYDSEKDFWSQARSSYIAGNGIIKDMSSFFNEIESEIKEKVDTVSALNKFGFVPTNTLDKIQEDYKSLANRREFEPFLDRLTASQTAALAYGVDKSAEALTQSSVQSLQAQTGVSTLAALQQRYGIDLTSKAIDLQDRVIQAGGQLQSKGQSIGVIERVGGEAPSGELPAGTDPQSIFSIGQEQPNTQQGGGANTEALSILKDLTDRYNAILNRGGSAQQTQTTQPVTEGVESPQTAPVIVDNSRNDPTTASKFKEITIAQGDSLSKIAQRELGDANRFQEIADLNKLQDPNKIIAGNKLRIPV